jgi:hypothetical protein
MRWAEGRPIVLCRGTRRIRRDRSIRPIPDRPFDSFEKLLMAMSFQRLMLVDEHVTLQPPEAVWDWAELSTSC